MVSGDDDDDPFDGPPEDRPMSLFAHLEELRKRLIRALLWLAAGTALCYAFSNHLMLLVLAPLRDAIAHLPPERQASIVQTDLGSVFFVTLKVSILFGAFLTGPLVLGQAWGFVAPGLYASEKRWFRLFAPLSYVLFAAGGAFYYWLVQPVMIAFFLDYGRAESDPVFGPSLPVADMIDVSRWFTLWLGMALVMGVVFQLPLVMIVAQLTGLVDARTFAAYRRHFIVGSVIVAAVLTPTGDALTLSIVMVPILFLYELGLLFCRMLGGRRKEARA